jgi:hypothetical protein
MLLRQYAHSEAASSDDCAFISVSVDLGSEHREGLRIRTGSGLPYEENHTQHKSTIHVMSSSHELW